MQHNLKEIAMYDYTKATKQYQELFDKIQQVNEFWTNSIISSIKEFFKFQSKRLGGLLPVSTL